MEESRRDAEMDKLVKKLPESFVDDVRASDEKTLRDKIVNLSSELEEAVETQKADSTLKALKEQLKDLNGSYNDVKKEKRNRIKYVLMTLESRGKL
jgi:hypothetical protein